MHIVHESSFSGLVIAPTHCLRASPSWSALPWLRCVSIWFCTHYSFRYIFLAFTHLFSFLLQLTVGRHHHAEVCFRLTVYFIDLSHQIEHPIDLKLIMMNYTEEWRISVHIYIEAGVNLKVDWVDYIITTVEPIHNNHSYQHEKWSMMLDYHQVQVDFSTGSTVLYINYLVVLGINICKIFALWILNVFGSLSLSSNTRW